MFKKFMAFLLMFVLAIGSIVSPNIARADQLDCKIVLTKDKDQYNVGDRVNITVEGQGLNVFGIEFVLNYDTSMLKLDDKDITYLESYSKFVKKQITDGQIQFALTNFTKDIKENNKIVKFSFVAQKKGTANVNLTDIKATSNVNNKSVLDMNTNKSTDVINVIVNENSVVKTIASLEKPADITVVQGNSVTLPSTVKATYSDGSTAQVSVTWGTVNTSVVGKNTIQGTVAGTTVTVSINVIVQSGSSTGGNTGGSSYINNTPVFDNIDSQKVDQGNFLQFKINAKSPNNSKLTYTVSNLPTGATFDAGNQTFNWTPNVDQAGSYIISFSVTDGISTVKKDVTVIVRDVPAAELVEKALVEKDFYHFNIAYYKVVKLKDETEKGKQLSKLATIHDLVWNKDIAKINRILDELVATGSGKIYDEVQAVINSSNLSAVDKGYLLGEVTSWGRKLVFTDAYKAAVDAVVYADKMVRENSSNKAEAVSKAEAAIAKVTNAYSKEYLLGELANIKAKMK